MDRDLAEVQLPLGCSGEPVSQKPVESAPCGCLEQVLVIEAESPEKDTSSLDSAAELVRMLPWLSGALQDPSEINAEPAEPDREWEADSRLLRDIVRTLPWLAPSAVAVSRLSATIEVGDDRTGTVRR